MSNYNALYQRYLNEADSYATRFGIDPGKNKTNNAWDAFRHSYASAAMTKEYGSLPAQLFGDLNEIYGDYFHNQKSFEKNMDYWNNAVGRRLGKGAADNDAIASRVYGALKGGDLITDPESDARHYSNFVATPSTSYPNRVYPGDPLSFGLPTGLPSPTPVSNPPSYYDTTREPILPPPMIDSQPLSQDEVERIRRSNGIPQGGLF
jgi:hypothetical protein